MFVFLCSHLNWLQRLHSAPLMSLIEDPEGHMHYIAECGGNAAGSGQAEASKLSLNLGRCRVVFTRGIWDKPRLAESGINTEYCARG
jgi:hypothetical protein